MNVYIAGINGQLGHDCQEVFQPHYQVDGADLPELDITSEASLDDHLTSFQPDVIINCAAYTQVDNCETHREEAWQANVTGPEKLASYAKHHQCKLIHISTDYVFDGLKPIPNAYLEEDETSPMSYYGITKLEGEQAVRKSGCEYAILRTAWLYGVNGHNFLKTMLRLASRGPSHPLKVVNDQYGSPTWSYRLAQQIRRVVEGKGSGIYHATSDGHCSWYELAGYFLSKMSIAHNIRPCTTEDYPTPAKRPKNSILENAHLTQDGLNVMEHWKDDVTEFVALYKNTLLEELQGKQCAVTSKQ